VQRHEGEISTDGSAPRCAIWGTLNVTPDSFSDGGRFQDPTHAMAHARRMADEGADVIDVGGASSRPRGKLYGAGASEVTLADEIGRVVPVVAALGDALSLPISVDTCRAEVARAALDAGASIINDVSMGASEALVALAAERQVDYVLMHTRGQGEVESPNTRYADVALEVRDELLTVVDRAVALGLPRERIVLDPGIGFAKTAAQSLELLGRLDVLVATGHRVLVGPSRKGFIAETASRPDGSRPSPSEREFGTAAAVTAAVLQGAAAVRVHDVAAMRQALLVAQGIFSASGRSARGGVHVD